MNLALETPTVTPTATSNSVTLKLENVSTTSDNLSVIAYMMLLPVDLTGKTLTVTLTDSEGETYPSEATVANDKTNFTANAARWINAVYEIPVPNNQIWYTSSDGNVVTPYKTDVFGANIVSNVYENGKGIITFDGDVTSIGNSAFDRISNLTSITIPNSVTSIGSYAFFHCSLTDITIPNSVTSIGESAFGGCLGLTSIVVESGNTVYDSRNNCNAIIITESNVLHTGCKNTIIPDGITSIGDYAFCMCGNLNSITIPNSVESIGEGAFYCCGLLEGITIPNSVITIESGAFEDCVRLTDITISNSIESIGANVFRQCISLTNITIPNSVKSIGGSAFSGCTSLSTIYVEPTTPPILGNGAFDNCANGYNIYVPAESLDAYKAANGWKVLNVSAEN